MIMMMMMLLYSGQTRGIPGCRSGTTHWHCMITVLNMSTVHLQSTYSFSKHNLTDMIQKEKRTREGRGTQTLEQVDVALMFSTLFFKMD